MKQAIKAISIVAIMIGSLNVFAFDNKGQAGAVIGAVVGGIVGSQVGNGTGSVIAAGIGVIAGAAIGNSIGKTLDRMDKQALAEAQQRALYAPVGTPVYWEGSQYGSNTGAYGNFQTTRRGHHVQYVNQECRSYRSEIVSHGRREVQTGTTCRSSNGAWSEVRSTEVRYY